MPYFLHHKRSYETILTLYDDMLFERYIYEDWKVLKIIFVFLQGEIPWTNFVLKSLNYSQISWQVVSLLGFNYQWLCTVWGNAPSTKFYSAWHGFEKDITLVKAKWNYFFSVIPYRSEFESYQKLTRRVYQKYLQVSNMRKLPKLNEFNSRVTKLVIKTSHFC